MDYPVTVILITELARIDPVISEEIERHSEAETDRKRYNSRCIRDVDNACNKRKEIACTGNEYKCNTARKLGFEFISDGRESEETPDEQEQRYGDQCMYHIDRHIRKRILKIVRKRDRKHYRSESRKERKESVRILTVHDKYRRVSGNALRHCRNDEIKFEDRNTH